MRPVEEASRTSTQVVSTALRVRAPFPPERLVRCGCSGVVAAVESLDFAGLVRPVSAGVVTAFTLVRLDAPREADGWCLARTAKKTSAAMTTKAAAKAAHFPRDRPTAILCSSQLACSGK